MQEQLWKLLNALALIGCINERFYFPSSEQHKTYVEVRLGQLPRGTKISIAIQQFWNYGGAFCYFVTYRHTNGDFMACEGTPFVEQALVDIGMALSMSSNAKTEN